MIKRRGKQRSALFFVIFAMIFGVFSVKYLCQPDNIACAEELSSNVIKNAWVTNKKGNPFEESYALAPWTPFRIYANYNLPNNVVKKGDTTTITLPTGFWNAAPNEFKIKVEDNIIANGKLFRGNPTKLVITYTDYVEKNSDINGSFFFNASIDYDSQPEKPIAPAKKILPVTLNVNGEIISAGNVDYSIERVKMKDMEQQGWTDKNDKTVGHYYININQKNEAMSGAKVVHKILTPFIEYIEDTFKIIEGEWVDNVTDKFQQGMKDVTEQFKNLGILKFEGSSFTIDLGDRPAGKGFHIKFDIKTKYEPLQGERVDNETEFINNGKTFGEIKKYNISEAGGVGEGYIYKIQIKKTDSAGTPLSGAEFDVIRVRNKQKVGTVKIGMDGSGEIGKLLMDTYELVEIKAPEGYSILTSPVIVKEEDFDKNKKIAVKSISNKKYFNNSYAATGSWLPEVTKILTGQTLKDDEFEFELKEGNSVLQTKRNKADGKIPFAAINYTLADVGEHIYTITEKEDKIPGIQYDKMTVIYKVKVADNGDGTLGVKVENVSGDMEFNNIYKRKPDFNNSKDKFLPKMPEEQSPLMPKSPNAPGMPKDGIPKTGDVTNLYFYIFILAVSGCVIIFVFYKRRRK